MQKNEQFADELMRRHWENSDILMQEFVVKTAATKGEGFQVSTKQGKIQIQAESPQGAVYGLSQMRLAAASGYLGDFSGNYQPKLALRPIWIGCGAFISLKSDLGLGLPSFFDDKDKNNESFKIKMESFCRRILEWGYNAVIIGGHEFHSAEKDSLNIAEVDAFFKLLSSYQLKIIVKPSFGSFIKKRGCCPLNVPYAAWLTQNIKEFFDFFPDVDYFYWESCLLNSEFVEDETAKKHTLSELVLLETQLLEKALPNSKALVYFIPAHDQIIASQQSKWMASFCDDVHKNTIVAFSSVAGGFFEDHLPPHPFWNELRKSPDISYTKLLPFVNIGQVFQGEGLWPTPTIDLIDKYFARLSRHHFAGVGVLINRLPSPGSMLDLSLWIASQAQWKSLDVRLLVETWLAAYHPAWNHAEVIEIFAAARHVAIELSFLRSLTYEAKRDVLSSEECRSMSESIIGRLKDLHMKGARFERGLKVVESPSLVDYLQIFGRDAKRIVLHFLQCFNLSYPAMTTPEEQQESFWHQSSPGAGQGIRSSVKVSTLNEPSRGAAGSVMEKIYKQNRWI